MVRSLLARLFGGGGSADHGDAAAVDETGNDANDDVDQDEENGGVNDVWDLIPSWEYDGKYVESGGHARGEQERALRDIQRQAAEIEHSENDGE